MSRLIACLLFAIGHVLFSNVLQAQNEYIIVDSIFIEGNKKTRGYVIFRELLFKAGDTLSLQQLSTQLNSSQQNLLNTQLFNIAEVNIQNWKTDNRINISIKVVESWYFFPVPIFELADRNFNVWWEEQNRSLKRVNLGVRLKYSNMTGHGDELKALFYTGYTQKYELNYNFPYLNQAKTIGAFVNLIYSKNKEINYNNDQNRQLFHSQDDLDLSKRYRARAGLSYRPNFYSTHYIRIEYHTNVVDTLVINRLNSNYFGNQQNKQNYGLIEYAYELDLRDLRIYPRKGIFFQGILRKNGFSSTGQNHLTLRALFQNTFPLLKRSAITNQTIGQALIEFNPVSFNLSKGHGYGDDFLRGFEFYVIDAQRFVLNKTKGKWCLLDKTFNFEKWMPFNSLKLMPLQLFMSTNFDIGYFRDRLFSAQSPLANRWIHSYGIGMDLVLFNNYAYTAEFSINQFKEKGLFLHFNVGL